MRSRSMSNILNGHVKAYEGNNVYDFDNAVLLNWYPKRIVALAPHTTSLLELGLGHGFATPLFTQGLARHVVLEGSPAVIANFRKNVPNCHAEIIETYFEKFVSRERFDVIVMGFILEHVDSPSEILAHYRQFLAPNGKLFVAVPNAEAMNRRLGHLAGLLPDMQTLSENDLLLGHKRFYTVDSLKSELSAAGYEVELMEGIYLKPVTTKQLLSLKLDTNIIEALCKLGVDYPELSCGILAQGKDAR
jgi:trans-aconitate methyltransferase